LQKQAKIDTVFNHDNFKNPLTASFGKRNTNVFLNIFQRIPDEVQRVTWQLLNNQTIAGRGNHDVNPLLTGAINFQ